MMTKITDLLIVDDDETLVRVFERLARERGWSYQIARGGDEAVQKLGKNVFAVALLDMKLPGYSGLQVLEYIKKNKIPTEVLMITGGGSVEAAVSAMKQGAYDFLTKPFDNIERIALVIQKAHERYEMTQKLTQLERQHSGSTSYEDIIGKSKKMQEIFSTIDAIASTDSTVLIYGESGTGKELIAHAIQRRSKRTENPFVIINCAAIPANLLESEFFGHRKGSFTGAIADRKGLFEEADKGTVFLDEIGELPLPLQVKILRVLQEGELRPIGETDVRKVEVRVIAATNRDLPMLVKKGEFREDLYYRLNVINLFIPPLRERAEDIPLLAYHFLEKCSKRSKKKIEKISVDTLQALQNYSWSGNVRELENVIERGVVMAKEDILQAQDLPAKILGESFYVDGEVMDADLSDLEYQKAKGRALGSFNRAYIGNLLRLTHGNVSTASEKAGMDRSNFKKLIKRYNINIDEYRHSSRK